MAKKQNKKIDIFIRTGGVITAVIIAINLAAITLCMNISRKTDGYSKQNEELIKIQKNIILDFDENKLVLGYSKTKIDNKYQITMKYDSTNNWWILKIKSNDFMELQEFTKCLKENGEYVGYFKYINEADYAKDYICKIVILCIIFFIVYLLISVIILYIIFKSIIK